MGDEQLNNGSVGKDDAIIHGRNEVSEAVLVELLDLP
jgi:hypothetical protein